jgi:hypothetical protein
MSLIERIEMIEEKINNCPMPLISEWRDTNFDDFVNTIIETQAEMKAEIEQLKKEIYGSKF